MCHRTEEKEGVVVFAFCCSILSLDVSKDRQKEEKTKSRISTMPILLIILLITVALLFLLVGVVVYCKNWDHYLVRRNCHIEPGMYRVYLERLRWSYVLLCLVLLVILIIVVFSVAIEQTIMQTPQTARRVSGTTMFRYNCSNVFLVSRSEWLAAAPKQTETMRTPVKLVFIHHTALSHCFHFQNCSKEVKQIQDLHMIEKGWSDIGYNFIIGEDGRVYEGRGWDRVGAHTRGYNSKSVSMTMIGDYRKRLPNEKALTALKNIISCGVDMGKVTNDYRLYGHRDASNTASPGDKLYALIQTWPHFDHTKALND